MALFADLAAQYDAALATGVNAAIGQALAANAATLTEAMTLYYLILGGLMAFREIDYRKFIAYCLRGAIVSALLVAATYQQLIAEPAMNAIPQWLTQSTSNGAALTIPQQLDAFWSSTNHMAAALYAQTTGIENIAYREEAAGINGFIGAMLTVTFFLGEFSKLLMGVLVATLPFLLALALFEVTREIPMRLVGTMVGTLILHLMLSILLIITIAADRTIILDQNNAVLAALAAGQTGIDVALGGFWALALTFFFGLLLLVGLPSLSAAIGGGVATNITHGLTGALGGIGGLSRSAGRLGNRAVNNIRRTLGE